ncbi:hypothetical protein CXB51_022126 [Gossypium anomalum]|uniref:Retrovirus-related Pol polyprotein from transposon TNT 1-94-like beta-barrel domain-containing protein n=1 Tax=Gossypium anomalum TaxID=47600 RepID=A0A8J6CX40_9ROSI|nr:hypothetical protein CXB51_022126 [Gossypium anomalum]
MGSSVLLDWFEIGSKSNNSGGCYRELSFNCNTSVKWFTAQYDTSGSSVAYCYLRGFVHLAWCVGLDGPFEVPSFSVSVTGLGVQRLLPGKKPENVNKTEWKELDEKALSAIQLCLTNTVLQEVLMEKTLSALWKRLETLYATKSLANRLVLKQRLFTFRMNKFQLLRNHISQFITLLNDLKNLEVHIDDEDQAMLLLCSLPPSYKSFRETLIYGRDKLSFEDVKAYLLSRDKLDNELHLDSKTDRQASVLLLRVTREDVAGANLVDENGDDFLLVSTSDNSKLTSEWVLDSGCSFYMCPNREWFSTYSSVEGGVVRMGNDSSSKVIGIGTVKIKMHDGTIRTLSDVRYVPGLRKNLISLSILDLKGCRINIESSSIKVSRGALVLLKESKSTRLKRRQLGHRREKCMTVSLKKGLFWMQCTSRRLEAFQFLSTNLTQLIPCIVQDRPMAGFGKDGVVEI